MKKISATERCYVRDGVPGLERVHQEAEMAAAGFSLAQVHRDTLTRNEIRQRSTATLRELAKLLASASPSRSCTIVVSRLRVLGWATADICSALVVAAENNVSVRVLDLGKTFSVDGDTAALLQALAATETARRRAVVEAIRGAGVQASAAKRERERGPKLEAALKDWERPVTEITAAEIADKHKISARSLASYLGPRKKAIRRAAERQRPPETAPSDK